MKWFVLAYLAVLACWDIRKKAVPAAALFLGSALVLGWSAMICVRNPMRIFPILTGTVPGICLLGAAYLTGKVGPADGWVLALLGALFGSRTVLFLLCVSLFLLSVISMALLMLRRANRNTRLPYLPYLAVSYLGTILWNVVNLSLGATR